MKKSIITLNEACEFIVDCLHKTAPIQEEGYPLIRTPNITRGRLDLQGVYRVSEEIYDIWNQRAIPQANDLIMAREAPAGNVAIIQEGQNVCLGQRTVLLRPNLEKVDPNFLCYFLLAPKQQGLLLSGETGATSKHVNMKDIRRLPLENIPDLVTQKKAGRILASYDDLIANNRRRIELLERSSRLLYREWFVHLRYPGHEHGAIDPDGIPEGWKKGTISDFYQTTSGGTPSRKNPDFFTGDINWVKTQELNEDYIFETEEKITEDAVIQSSAKIFPENTLLVSIYGGTNIGRTAILATPSSTNQACVAIIPNHELANPIYAQLFFYFKRQYLIGIAQGSAQTNISQNTLKQVEFLMPSCQIMSLFLDYATQLFDQKKTLQLQNQKLQAARDLLLPRLMNGEINV